MNFWILPTAITAPLFATAQLIITSAHCVPYIKHDMLIHDQFHSRKSSK